MKVSSWKPLTMYEATTRAPPPHAAGRPQEGEIAPYKNAARELKCTTGRETSCSPRLPCEERPLGAVTGVEFPILLPFSLGSGSTRT